MSCTTSGPFGAFPNCDTLGASLFLNLVYGCGLLQAANLISDGSELLLEVLSPGLVGGLLLPILGAVPDAAVIVASGLGATQEEAQEQVSVGMGTLAGSTVMLLTVAWGGSLWVGRCDLDGFTGKAIQKQCSHGLADSFANTGVTVDGDTTLNARIMMASCLAPRAAGGGVAGRGADGLADLVGAAAAFAGLAAYCAFQVLHPELQKRKIAAAQLRRAKRYGAQIAHHIGLSVGGIVVDGDINAAALDRLFDQFDADGNGQIEVHELKAALVAMSVTMKDYNVSDADVAVWLREFDRDGDGLISRSEFCGGMTHWVLEQTRNAERRDADGASADERISTIREPSGVVSTRSQRRGLSLVDPLGGDGMEPLLGAEAPDRDLGGGVVRLGIRLGFGRGRGRGCRAPTKLAIVRESALKLAAGMVLIALFADPMVGAVSSLSRACGMPSPFFASFVLTPFASNASELVSSLYFAAKKKKKNISLTYSQIYGAVTMNNTMCLGLFLVVMRAKGLEWTFTSETICVLAATVAVGAVGASKKTLKTSLVLPALAVYPLSLGLVVFLDFVVGLK